MKTFKNNAEKSTSRIKDVHAQKKKDVSESLNRIRKQLPDIDKMKIDLGSSLLQTGKKLIEAKSINFGYEYQMIWSTPLSFLITSGERINIKGSNGSGKTSLIKIILGELQPQLGIINRASVRSVYIDQDYSLINNDLTVYEQAQQFNDTQLQEHDIKIRLNRFLFAKEDWNKLCNALSGGEKMRLMLCCVMIRNPAPDLIVLDEPTNNLDIQNAEILTAVFKEYKGTLIVISHDNLFLEELSIERSIILEDR